MSGRALLFHLLLCFALVFNGAVSAAAAVHVMAAETPGSDVVAAPAMDAAGGGHCHEHEHAMASADVQSSDMAMHDDHSGKPGSPAAPDCCKSEACRCACVQSATLALPVQFHAGIAQRHGSGVRMPAADHASPILPHLIRPPIDQAS